MNDEEINEIIARSDEEIVIYRDYDIKRERDAIEAWKANGNRGKPPPPLMQLEELPEFYRAEEPFIDKNEIDEIEGRGQRRRTVVNYNDGLSDDQWAMVRLHSSRVCLQSYSIVKQALEDGEDLQELSERARANKDRRAMNKLTKDTDSRNSPTFDEETPRSRKSKKGKSKMVDQLYDATPSNGKRKRGKAQSITPSLNGEDDDDRDMVCMTANIPGYQLTCMSQKRRKTKPIDATPALREKLKKAYNDCYKAVLVCEDDTGRRRCDLFKDLPDKKVCPRYISTTLYLPLTCI